MITLRVAKTTKANIASGDMPFYWRTSESVTRYLYEGSDNIVVIQGAGGREDEVDLFIEDKTRPFIIFRVGRSRSQFFWMQLDLENPNPSRGGDLTTAQAFTAVYDALVTIHNIRTPRRNPTLIR